MKAVHTIDHVVNTILRWIVMIMLSVMSVVVFAQVVFRIVHLSIPWSEELSKYLLIWSTFIIDRCDGFFKSFFINLVDFHSRIFDSLQGLIQFIPRNFAFIVNHVIKLFFYNCCTADRCGGWTGKSIVHYL